MPRLYGAQIYAGVYSAPNIVFGEAALAGAGAQGVAGARIHLSALALTGVGAISPAPDITTVPGFVALTGAGSMSANAYATLSGILSAMGSGDQIAVGAGVFSRTLSLAGNGGMLTSGDLLWLTPSPDTDVWSDTTADDDLWATVSPDTDTWQSVD